MMGEVYNYGIGGFQHAVAGTRAYDFGDTQVDFFDYGFDALINMGFATHARLPAPDLFQFYANELSGTLSGVGVLNYMSSHDDQSPLDPMRENAYENAIKLLLAPGGVQIYYGDELNRSLVVEGTTGDATLRSFMNWDALETEAGRANLQHWQRLSNFRKNHFAIGAGQHSEHSWSPYVFSRTLNEGQISDKVLVGLADQPFSVLNVHDVFEDGVRVRDAYHGDVIIVESGEVLFATPRKIALLEFAD